MGDRVWAMIEIGGEVNREDFSDALDAALGDNTCSTAYTKGGDAWIDIVEKCLTVPGYRYPQGHVGGIEIEYDPATRVLTIKDDEANYGNFDGLEDWLPANAVASTHRWGSGGEFDAGVTEYRPATASKKRVLWSASSPEDGGPSVEIGWIRTVLVSGQSVADWLDKMYPEPGDLPPFRLVRGPALTDAQRVARASQGDKA